MDIEIWSDIACPWCHIGKRRFDAALAEFDHADEDLAGGFLGLFSVSPLSAGEPVEQASLAGGVRHLGPAVDAELSHHVAHVKFRRAL